MPQPNVNALHISAPLTNVSVAYRANTDEYIATKVFPSIPVDHKTDLYWTVPKGDWFRDEARVRADATESVGSGYELDQDTFNCRVEAIHKDIGAQARANADSSFNLDSSATEFVTDRLLLRREVQFTRDFLQTGVWGHEVGGDAQGSVGADEFVQWSDYDASTPVKDIKKLKRRMKATTGMTPNTLVLGYDVYDSLTEHPAILDKFNRVSSDLVDEAILAKYFGVDRIFVSNAIVNTGKEGNADEFGFLTGDVALLAYVAPSPGLLTPSAGYTFEWKGVSGSIGSTIGISKFPLPAIKADRVEGEIAYDNKVVAADLGIFLNSVIEPVAA
jgi:hypothetical protein